MRFFFFLVDSNLGKSPDFSDFNPPGQRNLHPMFPGINTKNSKWLSVMTDGRAPFATTTTTAATREGLMSKQ